MSQLMNAKAKEKKQEEIIVVRDFPKVFLDDLSGLLPVGEIEFRIELVPGAMPVAKSPYQFLGHVINSDGIHVQLSKIEAVKNWKSPRTPSEVHSFLGLARPRIRMCVDAKRILAAQNKACDESVGWQKGLDEMIKLRNDGALYYLDQIWVLLMGDVRTLIMDKAHKSKYSVHPRADKMYYDLRDRYWWLGINKDIVLYVSRCFTCLKVKAEYQRSSGSLQQPEIPEWKWEGIAMDFVTKILRWDRLARLYMNEIVARHGVPISIISDRDSQFTLKFWQLMKPLEFSVGDYVLLKVSPWKGMVRFGKKEKLAPRFAEPFEVIEKVSPVAYQLDLPEELNDVHDMFYVSNLKRCLADLTL
nr:putative reverse transcriptase domain-containing protein [Tanacetum cinerariifolium]